MSLVPFPQAMLGESSPENERKGSKNALGSDSPHCQYIDERLIDIAFIPFPCLPSVVRLCKLVSYHRVHTSIVFGSPITSQFSSLDLFL